MSYFSENYQNITYPIATKTNVGLRNAQIGAIHAIATHFTLYMDEPALVIMPTGSGKTAVLNLSAYVLNAKRVLVISSSVMVRGQIISEFENLTTLKRSKVFKPEIKSPRIKEIKSPIKSIDEWSELEKYDVVVGLPNSINTGINIDFKPNVDLFDLILVDEAHHVPAFTWNNIIKHFRSSKKIFFTATPFRRDKKEIEGRLAYNYPLTKAYNDKIFGEIGYYPVITNDKNTDLAIAHETERIFNLDKENGYTHSVMVRTETKDHAESLQKLYAENTKLTLKKVDSTLTYRTILKVIEQLKKRELDGVICVDMLGEGFDFPNLKIAAIHSPKKSLANTLQFIGRFARTNAENIGEAKFLAIPNDIEIGKKRLYSEGAIWNDIIKNLSEDVIAEDDETKKILDTFENQEPKIEKENLSFFNLNPYCHVKVYRIKEIDLDAILEISGHEILYHAKSEEQNAVFFITKESEKPKWIVTDDLINIKHYFFFIYHDEDLGLAFIHSSIKTNQFYDMLIDTFAVSEYQRISKFHLNKVLADIKSTEFFNIGMQNRSANSGESYRIIAGPNAEKTIRKSHSKNYANGHVFMKGVSEGENITIGYSTGSKIWSNSYQKIPSYIKWCKQLGQKINSDKIVKTNTGFDNLPIGKVVDNFQLTAHIAMWNGHTFKETPLLFTNDEDYSQLLDFEVVLNRTKSNINQLIIDLIYNEINISLAYDLKNHFTYIEIPDYEYHVEVGGHKESLISYLNGTPFDVYLDDFATFMNHEYYAPSIGEEMQYDSTNIIHRDWKSLNTDITREFYDNANAKLANNSYNSIHESLNIVLVEENNEILIYDHGTGEVADFISFKRKGDTAIINLYHIKGSGGSEPGDRVNDVYEVCMQAVKSQSWVSSNQTFKNKIKNRTENNPHKYISGDLDEFNSIMDNEQLRKEFIFTIVQPGISPSTFTSKLSYIIASTDDTIINNGYELIVIGSPD